MTIESEKRIKTTLQSNMFAITLTSKPIEYLWRNARVVDWSGLENRRTCERT